MNAKPWLLCLCAIALMLSGFALRSPVKAQGFAGLGTTAEGFTVPRPGISFSFPVDHGPHPDYRIEWWYLTANLEAADGTKYGVQWTLFRSGLVPGEKNGWSSPQVWMGHAAVTTPEKHYFAERLSRGGTGQAGVIAAPFEAWIDDWRMQRLSPASPDNVDELSEAVLHASGKDFRYDLQLQARGPIVAQGQGGYSVKSAAGQASYYYSQPFYTVDGMLALPEGEIAVTGQAWLDREWSSQPLAADQTGWDWFSLHFESGEKLMGFRLRDSGQGYTSATWISADGKPAALAPGELKVIPLETADVAGRKIPIVWRIELPSLGLDVTTSALNPRAWMATRTPYWEGPIRFEGTHGGRGYLEMTGY